LPEALPLVSVVVPTRERPAHLRRTLAALFRLDYPRDRYEVIVVADGDNSTEAIAAGFDVRVLTQASRGQAAARNRAAEAARGELLAFTDDDCTPAPDWLSRIVGVSRTAPEAAVGGRTLTAFPGNAFSAASQEIVRLVYAYYNDGPRGARFFASNNLAVPAERFRAVGGFDEQFSTAEDREFCDRWLQLGGQLVYCPDALVMHANRVTLGGFLRQHFGYGRGALKFHRKRGGIAPSVRRELGFHRALPRLMREGRTRPDLFGLLVVWQIANAAGFAWESVAGSRTSGEPFAAESPRALG
jgi:GT2 family glycosyltransferase